MSSRQFVQRYLSIPSIILNIFVDFVLTCERNCTMNLIYKMSKVLSFFAHNFCVLYKISLITRIFTAFLWQINELKVKYGTSNFASSTAAMSVKKPLDEVVQRSVNARFAGQWSMGAHIKMTRRKIQHNPNWEMPRY